MPQNDRASTRKKTSLILLVIVLSGWLLSCGHEATLIRDMQTGGLVSYPVQTEADVLSSDGRRDAFRIIREKCPQGSRILKEGEITKVSQTADRVWRGQMGTDRVWGIQFACESTEPR